MVRRDKKMCRLSVITKTSRKKTQIIVRVRYIALAESPPTNEASHQSPTQRHACRMAHCHDDDQPQSRAVVARMKSDNGRVAEPRAQELA